MGYDVGGKCFPTATEAAAVLRSSLYRFDSDGAVSPAGAVAVSGPPGEEMVSFELYVLKWDPPSAVLTSSIGFPLPVCDSPALNADVGDVGFAAGFVLAFGVGIIAGLLS